MTFEHYIGMAVGAVVGVLVTYLLVKLAKRDPEDPSIGMPFDMEREDPPKESFADVKDTF